MTFLAKTTKDGKLQWATPYNESRWLDFCQKNDKELRIEVAKNPVSNALRNYYWGAVLPTVRQTIHEWEYLADEDLNQILKKNFNGFTFYNVFTKRTEKVGRSAMSGESNTARAMQFVERIGEWLASEYGVELPSVDEYKQKLDSAELRVKII